MRSSSIAQFIDPAVAAVAGVNPASITNGAPDGGGDREPARRHHGAHQSLRDNDISVDGVTFIMSPANALSLSFRTNLDGSPQFPGIGLNGGSYRGPDVHHVATPAGTNVIALQPRAHSLRRRRRRDDRRVARGVAPDGQRAGVTGGCDDRLCLALADEHRRPARRAVRQLEARRSERGQVPHRGGLARAAGCGVGEPRRGERTHEARGAMRLFGFDLSPAGCRRDLVAGRRRGGWFPVIREPYTGAWQRNAKTPPPTALANPTVFACVTLIASDIGKVRLRLVQEDDAGIWTETSSPAFSPVLRKPNRAQTIVKFLETWLFSKLLHGNTYVLKERDARGVVTALYLLDPARVTPLVTPDGAVYYQLAPGDGLIAREADVTVPAREIIHDRFNCLFHQLVGMSPLFAGGGPAAQGQKIQDSSIRFFSNNARPSGRPHGARRHLERQAARTKPALAEAYSGENFGESRDPTERARLQADQPDGGRRAAHRTGQAHDGIDLRRVPRAGRLVDSSHAPPYGNSEPLLQRYYSQCLQTLMTSLETSLDEGLELPTPYGTEFDIDDLYWMDTATRTKAAHDAIGVRRALAERGACEVLRRRAGQGRRLAVSPAAVLVARRSRRPRAARRGTGDSGGTAAGAGRRG